MDVFARVNCVVPVISDQSDLLALFVGPQSKILQASLISVHEMGSHIFVDAELPKRLNGVTESRQGEEDNSFRE